MRERMLALLQGRQHDRVPFVIYDKVLPVNEVHAWLGRGRIGVYCWSAIHRVEHPHCEFETEEYCIGDTRWERTTLHTPAGSLWQERAFEPTYNTGSIRKHYVQDPHDYQVLWCYLEDCVLLPDYDRYYRAEAALGDTGLPLPAVERTPYQQLWVQWTGLQALAYHLADYPELVAHTMEMLEQRNRCIFEIAYHSPALLIDVPDNITASSIGPSRFRDYCVPQYNKLAEMLAERDAFVVVHMDGDLKALAPAIAGLKVRGIDSFTPAPDTDTTVAEAVSLWPNMCLLLNFPSSLHLSPALDVSAAAEAILAAAGHTGRLQIQISENVPYSVWRTSLPAIADAIGAFGRP